MLRAIIIQLWNRKRANLSVVLELLCVFILIWYMTDYLFVYAYNRSIPSYQNTEHTWLVRIGVFEPDAPGYVAEADSAEAYLANFERVLQTLHAYPGITDVAVSNSRSYPGSGGYRNTSFCPANDTTNIIWGHLLTIFPGEDYFHLFRFSRDEGREMVSVKDFDWAEPRGVVISRAAAEQLFPAGNAVGQEVLGFRESVPNKIIGVVDEVKRFPYLRPRNVYYMPMQLDGEELKAATLRNVSIMVRSRSEIADASFKADFQQAMNSSLLIGNYYLKNILSIPRLESEQARIRGVENDIRIRLYLMAFFLLSILLCLMGSFWYRVNQRRGEIGLRKALGASQGNIHRQFLLEGLCLLALAAVVAMGIELQFVKAELIDTLGLEPDEQGGTFLPDNLPLRFLITNAITTVLLAAAVLLAIWFPARRASRVSALDALRTE